MNKGCIIGLVVGLAILIIGGIGIGFVVVKITPATLLFAIEETANNYLKENPDSVPATNEEWVAALKGTDYDSITMNGRTTTMEVDAMIQKGKFMDMMGKNDVVFQVTDGVVKTLLPGKDGEVGTADDVTADFFRKFVKK